MPESTLISQSSIDNHLGPSMTLNQNTGFDSDLVINSNFYFIIGADNITIDGNNHTVNIVGSTAYPGLINNSGYSNVTVKNIIIKSESVSPITTPCTLNTGAGWIGQSGYGSGSGKTNIITNCHNRAPINNDGGGGIVGTHCGQSGTLTISYCSNSGIIVGNSEIGGAGGMVVVLANEH